MGYETIAYPELTDLVRMIEIAIGTENTMKLGKGNIYKRITEIMNMTDTELMIFLASCDNVYIYDSEIRNLKRIRDVLQNKLWPYESDLDMEEIEDDYKFEIENIEKLKNNSYFISWCKENSIDNSDKALYKYIKEKGIEFYEGVKQIEIVNCESMILNRYFLKDFDKLFNENNEFSIEDYKKCRKIISLLNTKSIELPNEMLRVPTSIKFKQEFEKKSKEYMKHIAKEYSKKYENNEISFKDFFREIKKLIYDGTISNYDLLELIKEFSLNISNPEFYGNVNVFLLEVYRLSDNYEILDKFSNFSIYKIVSKDKRLNSEIVCGKGDSNNKYFWNYHRVIKDSNEKVSFDFTEEMDFEGEYPLAIKNFSELQKKIFQKNPNSKIHIINREIVVQDGDNYSFFYIDKGEFIPMDIESQFDSKFLVEEKQKNNIAPPIIKVSRFSEMVNFIKRKWNSFKNRNKRESINYNDKENNENLEFITTDDKMDSYRIDDFDKRLKEHQSLKKEDDNIRDSSESDKDRFNF